MQRAKTGPPEQFLVATHAVSVEKRTACIATEPAEANAQIERRITAMRIAPVDQPSAGVISVDNDMTRVEIAMAPNV